MQTSRVSKQSDRVVRGARITGITPILGFVLYAVAANAEPYRHTSPACWDEARIYAPLQHQDDYRIAITRAGLESAEPRVPSSNNAYAFVLAQPVYDEKTQSFRREVFVFVERPYLLQLTFPNVRDISEIRWVNERLVYIRAWRGRIAGTDFIVDVESEAVVHQEPFEWGAIAFEQYKQCGEDGFRDEDRCQCLRIPSPLPERPDDADD